MDQEMKERIKKLMRKVVYCESIASIERIFKTDFPEAFEADKPKQICHCCQRPI